MSSKDNMVAVANGTSIEADLIKAMWGDDRAPVRRVLELSDAAPGLNSATAGCSWPTHMEGRCLPAMLAH